MHSFTRFLAILTVRTALHMTLTGGAVLGVAPSVLAQEDTSKSEQVDVLKQRANMAMDSGRPADALALYNEAYSLNPAPGFLYNIGRAHQALAQYPSALDFLLKFEQAAPLDLKARVPGLAALIVEVRGRIASVMVQANVPGAVVRLNGRRLGKTPFKGPIQVNAGAANLEVTAEGYLDYSQKLKLEGGKTINLDVTLDSKETHGLLEVRSPGTSAHVVVDGKMRGMVPLELRLPAGQHRIELHKEGFETVSTVAVVQAGKRKVFSTQMEAEPMLYERWWFWTGIGVVAAGTVTTIVIYNKEKEAEVGTIPPGQISAGLLRF